MKQSAYEQKSVLKAVLQAGLPAMLGQLTTLIYNLADAYFVSTTRDAAQIAAVTLCSPVLLIIMSIALVFGIGGSSVVARLLGAGREAEVRRNSSFCLYGTVITGLICSAAGLLLATPIARAIGADAGNLAYTVDYLRYIFLGTVFIMFSSGELYLLRAAGLIRQGTAGLILGNGVNIVLDYVFIQRFGWGTAGAALATSLGYLATTVYYVACMHQAERRGCRYLPLTPREFWPTGKIVAGVVKIGIPGSLVTILMSAANIVLNNYLELYGSDAVAAYGIAYRIDMIPVMLSVGLAQGVTPLIGFCYGARDYKRMKKTVYVSNALGILLGGAFLILFLLRGRELAGAFFPENAALQDMAAHFLRIICVTCPLITMINIVNAYFQALGKAVQSLTITVVRNAVLFIGSIVVLNHFFRVDGVVAAQPVTEVLIVVVCIIMYVVNVSGLKKARGEV